MSKASDHGFSLIEVVVALGVLSTAAIGFSTFSRDSTAGVRQLEARYLARAVAEASSLMCSQMSNLWKSALCQGRASKSGESLSGSAQSVRARRRDCSL